MERIQWPLFVTLTTVNYKTGPQCIRDVRRALGKLRRLVWWKKKVTGGVAAVEVTNRGKGWHPHVHMLLDCQWLSVSEPIPPYTANKEQFKIRARRACNEVAQQWALCLDGRRGSCKVRRVWKRDEGNIRGALCEVLKYSITTENLLSIKGDLSPLLEVLDKTRMITSFGTCFKLGVKRKKGQGIPCERCDSKDSWMPTEQVHSDITRIRQGKSTSRL